MDRVTFFFGGWEPVARILVVGPLAYAALVLLLRISGKRTLARMNAFDFIVTVAIGAVFGRVVTARSVALAEAVAAFALLVILQYIMSALQIRFPAFASAVTSPPTLLFYSGRVLHQNLRKERLTEPELQTAIREHGVGSYNEVEAVVLESDGRFAVIKKKTAGDHSAMESLAQD